MFLVVCRRNIAAETVTKRPGYRFHRFVPYRWPGKCPLFPGERCKLDERRCERLCGATVAAGNQLLSSLSPRVCTCQVILIVLQIVLAELLLNL